MSKLEKWFEEAEKETLMFSTSTTDFIIYKGFKISCVDDIYILQDARYSNLYSEVSEKDLKIIEEKGFIKGVDTISLNRDTKRVASYRKRAEALYEKRAKFKKELPRNKRLNLKRIRNINKRIGEYIDLMFFYETRIKHFNNKHKEND